MQLSEITHLVRMKILRDGQFKSLGLLSHDSDSMLVVLYDSTFLDKVTSNSCISCVITTLEISSSLPEHLGIAVCEDPKAAFYKIHYYLLKETNFYWEDFDSEISPKANIHERAYVSPLNVRIGSGCIVEPNAVILERSILSENVVIRSGAVIGGEGFEPKYVDGKHIIIPHAGGVLLRDDVEIQANTHVAQSVFGGFTEIGEGSKIDALVRISHNVIVGSNCEIAAGAVVAGSTVIGDRVWIGPNVTTSSDLRIGDDAFIGLGAIVTKNVDNNAVVLGVLARSSTSKTYEYALEGRVNQSGKIVDSSQLKTIIADAVQCLPEEITDTLNSDDVMGWDSLAKFSIAASLYDLFDIHIPAEKIFKLDSLKSIEQLIADSVNKQNTMGDQSINLLDSVSEPSKVVQTIEIPNNHELWPLCERKEFTQALAHHFEGLKYQSDKKIIVAATFTAQMLRNPLEQWCQGFKMNFAVEFAEYNQLEQILLSPDSIFTNNLNGLNIILTRPEDLISERDLDGMIRAQLLLEAINSYTQKRKGLIVSNLPPAVSSFFQGNHQQVEKLRLWWQEQLNKIEGIHVLDLAGVIEQIGRMNSHDPSLEAVARAPYSQLLYQELGIEIVRLVRSIIMPAKKVVALDCDGILWGGILGEDGIDGIVLSNEHPGRSFRLLQEMILALKKRGVLLVLVSKNEEADVWNVFDNHPEMLLRRSDIAGYRINWAQKSANLYELAQELNLGLDSFVFVDDSPVERLEIETTVPEVTVVPMPKEPARYCETLSKLWCFDSSNTTEEDMIRTDFIAMEQKRRDLQQSTTGLQSYLESLNLVAEIRFASQRDLSRVAQLTQKTNQFNLSLIRRSLTEIQELHASTSILVLNLKDCFGDYGLVGLAILKEEDNCMFVDTFLMSCRALGRGAEEAFLCTLFDFAAKKGLEKIIARYNSGVRNEQVKTFLLKMGFLQKQTGIFESHLINSCKKPKHVEIQVDELFDKQTVTSKN
jgi:FkbH-like protein